MIFSYLLNMQSHPSWVCGLKRFDEVIFRKYDKSHPSWVCGLKLLATLAPNSLECHTLRGCVD